MDFFCQRCSKPLELDESLLEIDQSLFVNKEIDEISNIIKDISLKTKIASAAAATNEQEQQRAEQLQLQQQLQKNAATTTSVSKFSRGLFNRKSNKDSPLKDQINTSSNNLSNTLTTNNNNNNTTINTSTSTLNNNTQQTTQPFFTPISSSSTLNNNNGSISGSPTSFGSLSQHRLSSSISSSSSSSTFLKGASTGKLPTIDVGTMSSSSSSSSSSSMNRPIKGSTSSMTRGSEDFSKSYEPGMLKRMASQQNKRHHLSNSTKNLAINTSINKHPILASPPGKSSTMMQHSSNSLMSSPVQSHHGGKTQKLKYLRSNEKSQSMASLDHLHMHQSTASSSLTSTPLMNPINHSMSAINTAAIAGGVGGSSTTSTPIGSPPMMVQGGNSSTTGTPTQIGMGVSVGSSRYLQAMSLFKLVTDLISYDLPLCLECTKMAIHEMDDENGVLEAEIDVYNKFLCELEDKQDSNADESIDCEIEKYEQEEAFLLRIIANIQRDRNELEEMEQTLRDRERALGRLEERYWEAYSTLQLDAHNNQDDRASVHTQTSTAIDKLKKLKETNILNDAFHLWHDGHFGTINSLRLGRLPSQPVEWSEINSAWGLSISLLENLAKRLNFTFTNFKLMPNGSTSRIEDTSNNAIYELYGSSDISLGKLFWYRRFDNGMVSFLSCLKELCDHVKTQDPTFEVPYLVEKEHINGMPIKVQFTNDDTWTKALKYMLTNLKWLLSWVAKNESTQPMNIIAQQQQQQKHQPPPTSQQQQTNTTRS